MITLNQDVAVCCEECRGDSAECDDLAVSVFEQLALSIPFESICLVPRDFSLFKLLLEINW